MGNFLRTLQLFVCGVCCLCGCAETSTTPQRDSEVQSSSHQKQFVAAEQPTGLVVRKPIARVLGKEIFEDDLALPASVDQQHGSFADAELREYRQTKLKSLIWQPLADKYCLERQLEATPDEIERFNQAMGNDRDIYLQELHKDLESDEVTDSEKAYASELINVLESEGDETASERLIRWYRSKLQSKDARDEEKRTIAEALEMLEAQQEMPSAAVKWWKFNRALYAQFGGVVIFQQLNPFEPVGAYRKWFEHHEEVGDFEILDDEARAAFWDYFKRDWENTIWVTDDPDPFGQPWWLKIPAEEIKNDHP